jgi:integrase
MLWQVIEHHRVDLQSCMREQLLKMLDTVRAEHAPAYYTLFLIVCKMSLKFLGRGELADSVENPKAVDRKTIVAQKILPEEDVKRLIEEAATAEDRLLVELFYETGARRGEIAALRIRDVQFEQTGGQTTGIIQLTGKTGTRRRRVYASVPDLREHLNNHPQKGKPDAPLLLTSTGKLLTWEEIYRRIHELGTQILGRPIHPHQFRHTRATLDSKYFTDRELKKLHGWKTTSIIEVYSDLSMKDVDDKDLIVHGLKSREEVLRPIVHVQRCSKCKQENAPIAVYCSQCGSILQTAPTEQDREHVRELEERLAKLEAVYTERLTLKKE